MATGYLAGTVLPSYAEPNSGLARHGKAVSLAWYQGELMASAGMAPAQASERAQLVNERMAVSRMVAVGRIRAGAKWFYWIAGLSIINSLAVIFKANFHFVVGLGVSSLVDAFARRVGSAGSVLDLIINGFIAGVFVLFGAFAVKAQRWAFLAGMALYLFDGLLLVSVKQYLGVAFHAYALYAIYRGFIVTSQLPH